VDGPKAEAEEAGRVLEAAWPLFARFFGAEPARKDGERLRVSLLADASGWAAAIRAAGGTPPDSGAGGYYDPISRGAYLYRQPSAWYTRTLLLHEAAHQFHFLARTANRSPPAGWYVEGLAEHLSHHAWDGTTLHLGVVPLLSLEDRAAKALAAMTAPDFSLEALVEGRAGDRPEQMHLVRFLKAGGDTKRAERFDELAAKLDRGAASSAAVARALGKPGPLLDAVRAWLPSVQQPFVPVHVDWDVRGPRALRGTSGGVSVCRVRGPARRVAARLLVPADGPLGGGLLLHVESVSAFTVALVGPNSIRVQRLTNGRWDVLATAPWTRAAGPLPLSADRRGADVTVNVGELALGPFSLPGDSLGLAVDASTLDFTDLAWD
jgi:hypothetical protein